MIDPDAQFNAIDAVIAKAVEDPGFRADFIKQPEAFLKEAGYVLADNQDIVVLDLANFERPPPLVIYLPPPASDLMSTGEMHELLVAAALPEGCGEIR